MLNDNHYARVSDFEPMEAELKATRQYLHANPELSLEEAETARYVAEKLEGWGYEVTRNVGGHGVVACLTNGTGKKSIGIRADMDALPILEETGLPYASKTPGKMHACGHDGHTTVLLGAAEYLARTRRFDGTVTLIFQPAEENGKPSGAQKMIERGEQPTEQMEQDLDRLLGQVQGSTLYQGAVSAQENFDKVMLRVNDWIFEGIKKGSASSIITLG